MNAALDNYRAKAAWLMGKLIEHFQFKDFQAAGGQVDVDGGSVSGCTFTGCGAIQTSSAFTGGLTVHGVQIVGTTHGIQIGAGSQVIATGNIIGSSTSCFQAAGSVTKFSFSNNSCNNTGAIIQVLSGDFFTIIGNVTGASTVNGNVSNTGGAHNTITGNW